MKIIFQPIPSGSVDCLVGIGDHFLEVIAVYLGDLMATWIVLAVRFIEIYFSQHSSCGSLGRTAFICLCRRQHAVSELQIVCNQLPTLVIGIFGVGQLRILILSHIGINDKGDILIETF